jgi:tRNA-2-methylthio-N6-dimethylallyladenosine synthase
MIFTFVYSPRQGTPAATMEGQIPHEEKVRRFNALTEMQNENALRTTASYRTDD